MSACACMFGFLACMADFLPAAECAESSYEPYAVIAEKRDKNLTGTRLLSSKLTNDVLKKCSCR